jgi:hypothetical protein
MRGAGYQEEGEESREKKKSRWIQVSGDGHLIH